MLDIVSAVLAASATTEVAQSLWKLLRERLKEKGAEDVPTEIVTPQQLKQAETVVSEKANRFSANEARQVTVEALARAQDAANGIRAERMRQARLTFNAAIGLTVLGVLIIFAGVILLLVRDEVTAGAITAGVGAVTEVVSALLFRLNHETNNRLDAISNNLSVIEAARIAVALSDKIENTEKRDDAIKEAARDLRARSKDREV